MIDIDTLQDWSSDLKDAVSFYLQLCEQNLTPSEHRILCAFNELSTPAVFLFEKLYSRKPDLFRLEDINYFQKDIQSDLLLELANAHLIWRSPRWIDNRILLQLSSIVEIKELCKVNKCRRTGKKETLIERLLQMDLLPLEIETVFLRQQELLKRICITYLRDHQGDINTLLLNRLEHVPIRFYPYEKSWN